MPTLSDMLIGNMGGSLGEVSALALLLGMFYMLWKKIITWHVPVSIFVTVFVFTGIMHLVNPVQYASPFVHLLSGGLMLGAIFMATDYVTSPMSKSGMIVYGVGIGILTTVIRLFGSYPEGMSFAIFIMNGVTPLINSYMKPKHFGGNKHGKTKINITQYVPFTHDHLCSGRSNISRCEYVHHRSDCRTKAAALEAAIKAVTPAFDNKPTEEAYMAVTADGDSLKIYRQNKTANSSVPQWRATQ